MNFLNKSLDRITMYRLVLYVLCAWLIFALILSAAGLLPFSPLALIYSAVFILIFSWISNKVLSLLFKAPTNPESVYITALILALLILPPISSTYISILPILALASFAGAASKFFIAVNKKHIFNPAAVALVVIAIFLNESAAWWIANANMLPFVLFGGFLIVKKIRRFDMVIAFILTALIASFGFSGGTVAVQDIFYAMFASTPLIFLATVMLTEPQTEPKSRNRRILYGMVIGILFTPGLHIGSFYFTPELAILAGNLSFWLFGQKRKYVMTLISKREIAVDTDEFVFKPDHRVSFLPGQYMEWTLDHKKPDTRGSRRFFTIASSPTENELCLGIKFDPIRSSSFKLALSRLQDGQTVIAGHVTGDFILPNNPSQKICFMAGGIGITPFRSMLGYLANKNEKRDIILLYSVKSLDEVAYYDQLNEYHEAIGLKYAITLTDKSRLPADWNGNIGFIDANMIRTEVPDYASRIFYISGPHSFVTAVKGALLGLGIKRIQIKTDYFPGYV